MSYLREFSPKVSQIRVLSPIDLFTACYNCMSKNFQNVISPGVDCTDITNRVLKPDLTVLRVITIVWTKTSKMSYISEFSVEVSQIVFSAQLTVLRLVTTVRVKTSKISYLREFSPQVSQIVFLAQLTVLRLVTTVWVKTFKMSYLRELSAQISQIVFSSWFDRFTGYYNCKN